MERVSILKMVDVGARANTELLVSAAAIGVGISTMPDSDGWIACADELPPDETEVLIMVYHPGYDESPIRRIGSLEWDIGGPEDSYQPYKYWDDPYNEGMDWAWDDVTHWQHLPTAKVITE